ncbi:MAG: conjugal transfer protein TraS, partial [Betaproteobacteria bacterium]
MKSIAAHFRYISRNGRLDIEDDRGETSRGKSTLAGLADDWRYGGTFIEDAGDRREAYNIMLSMPRGPDPLAMQRAAREFSKVELADHKYV